MCNSPYLMAGLSPTLEILGHGFEILGRNKIDSISDGLEENKHCVVGLKSVQWRASPQHGGAD